MNMMANNHTTEAEAEASTAVEIQTMDSNSNSNNANTKRLGNEKSGANYCNSSFFSMFNGLFGFTVMAVIVTLFIVIAVFAGPDTTESVMMTASQQEAIVSAKSTKAPKARSKAPTGATTTTTGATTTAGTTTGATTTAGTTTGATTTTTTASY